jgi:hypothetical protein
LTQRILIEEWLLIVRGWIFLLLLEYSSPPDELLGIGIDMSNMSLDPDDMS